MKETIITILAALIFAGSLLYVCINIVKAMNDLYSKQEVIIEKCEKQCNDYGCLQACYEWEARK